MQREIEIKVLNIDVDKIEEKLTSLGAKLISDEEQENYTYVPKDSKFDNGYLRIRETKDSNGEKSTEITFKEVKGDDEFRINDEYTVNIDSISMMSKILEQCGIVLQYQGQKHRKSYSYKGQRFDIDIWDEKTYPHPYMEIEFSSQDMVDEILSDLSIDRSDVTTDSISQLREKLK